MNQWDREEQQLEHDYGAGLITRARYDELMREIQRDRRDAAHEAAHDAYERELDRW